MSYPHRYPRLSGRDTLEGVVIYPVLAAWAMVSFLPFFAFIGFEQSLLDELIEGLFFVSGAWGVLALVGAARLMVPSGYDDVTEGLLRKNRVALGVYAIIWTSAYMGYQLVK